MKYLILVLGSFFVSSVGLGQMHREKESWVTRYLDGGGKIDDITGLKQPRGWQRQARWDNVKAVPGLPAHFDWNDYYQLQEIKNQGQCGSCWAFSVTAVVEALYMIKNEFADNSWYDLAEQTLVSSCEKGGSCQGGYFTAFSYIKDVGLPHEEDDKYQARNTSCKQGIHPLQKIVEWKYVGKSNSGASIEEMKTALYQYGPLSVDVNASFGRYGSGVYTDCGSGRTNHMVTIEGWHEDPALSDNGGGYWIMRNSWGKSWGENGYMRIAYLGKSGSKCNSIGNVTAYAVIEGLEASKENPLGARAQAKGIVK